MGAHLFSISENFTNGQSSGQMQLPPSHCEPSHYVQGKLGVAIPIIASLYLTDNRLVLKVEESSGKRGRSPLSLTSPSQTAKSENELMIRLRGG